MAEKFEPIKHISPDGILNKSIFLLRLFFDFQFSTIYSKLKKKLPYLQNNILDVGCGNSPFKHLLDSSNTKYYGLDIDESNNFNYSRTDITYFNGVDIPFDSEYFDNIICTEVLEHTQNPVRLINEMERVLKKNGTIILSVPWSARNHYIPYDYYRYTETTLSILFSNFTKVYIKPRGTDVTVIVNKIIVIYFRQFKKLQISNFKLLLQFIILAPFIAIFAPLIFVLLLIGHLSIIFNIGSTDDCLGYYLVATK